MGRLSTAAKTELEKPNVSLGLFSELHFKTGVERYWSGIYPIDYNGSTWTPTGQLGEVSSIESSDDFHANGLTLSMRGLPGDALRNARSLSATDYKGRQAKFIIAVMDAGHQSVIHGIERFYRMDMVSYEITSESGAAVSIQLENEVRYASRTRVRRYSDQQQQSEYPGDKGLGFLPYLNSGVEAKWGTQGAFFK